MPKIEQMKQRLLTFWILILAVSLASWKPQPSAKGQRVAQALAVAVADTDSIVRNAPVPLTKGDTARRYIKLLPGFEVIPQNGQFYVATIDTARRTINAADTSCFIRIKSLATNGQETNQLPRTNGTLQPLTLSVQDLVPAGFWNTGAAYRWTTPTGATANTVTFSAPTIGNYGLTLTKNGRTCQTTTVLRGSACQTYDTLYACNPNATNPTVPDDPNNRLSNLAAGDTVYAADFIAVILSVEGGNANSGWTGQAKVRVPYLGQELLTTFENARFNSCYQLTDGSKLESVYDPAESNIIDPEVATIHRTRDLLVIISDLLRAYQDRNKPQLQGLVADLTQQKAAAVADTNLTQAQRVQMGMNLDSALNVLNTFVGCNNTGWRVAATSSCDANNIQPLIEAMVPQTKETVLFKKTLSFGGLTPDDDVSRKANDSPNPNLPNNSGESNPAPDVIQRRTNNRNGMQRYSEADLRYIFENGKGLPFDGIRNVLSSDSEQRVLGAFYGGGGRTLTFNENDAVSKKLDDNPTFVNYYAQFINRMRPWVNQNNFNAITDSLIFAPNFGGIDRLNFSIISEIPLFDYYGLMGGVQRIEVLTTVSDVTYNVPTPPYINNTVFLPSTRRIIKTIFTLRDWFGADWEDLASPFGSTKSLSASLKAFFMLQHYKNHHQPFETVIKHRKQISSP